MWRFYNTKFTYRSDYDDIDKPWFGHTQFAYDLVRNLNPQVVVELGTHRGTSFYSMVEALKDTESLCKAYAVDSWEGDEHAGTIETGYQPDEVYNFVIQIIRKFYPEQNILLIKKFFNDAVSDFENKSINILHIDGLHTYDAVKEDYFTWKSKLSKNSIVLFHDIQVADFGVRKLWDEIQNDFDYCFEFHHSHGLGVGVQGDEYVKIIKDITTNQELLRKYYKAHSAVVAVNRDYKKLTDQNALTLQERDDKIIDLRQQSTLMLQERDDEIKNLQERVTFLRNEIDNSTIEYKSLEHHYLNALVQLNKISSRKFVKAYLRFARLIGKDPL